MSRNHVEDTPQNMPDLTQLSAQAVNSREQEIIQDPGFRLLTALLWIRSSGDVKATNHNQNSTMQKQKPDSSFLSLHRDRLEAAIEAAWYDQGEPTHTAISVEVLEDAIRKHLQILPAVKDDTFEYRKVRIQVVCEGTFEVDSTVISVTRSSDARSFVPVSLELPGDVEGFSQVFIDTQATQPSIFTTHKTSHRGDYDDARRRAGVSSCLPTAKEVLLYNTTGMVMEGSTSTVYFHRNGFWVTPAAECGGNLGVSRRLALENTLCKEGTVKVSEVQDGEKVWLSNAVRGFFPGVIRVQH